MELFIFFSSKSNAGIYWFISNLDNNNFIERIESNSKENVRAVFNRYFEEEISKLLNNDVRLYKRIVDNDKLKRKLESALFDLIYQEYDKIKKKGLENVK